MLTDILLPWWGWVYLIFVLVMFIAGLFVKDAPDISELSSSIFSLFSICIFVVGFSNAYVTQFLGVFIVPMAVIGIYWEFTRAVRETGRAQNDLLVEKSLSEEERAMLLNIAIGLNALVVVPGYVMGIVLSFRVIGVI